MLSSIFSLSTLLLLSTDLGFGTLTTTTASRHWGAHAHTFQKRQKLAGASILAVDPVTPAPNFTNSTAYWIAETPGVAGACMTIRTDKDLSFGITSDLWNFTGISPLCGTSVFILNPANGKNVTAIVSDESTGSNSLLSYAAFVAIADTANNATGIVDIQYYFLNATTAGSAIVAASSSGVVSRISSSSTGAIPAVAASIGAFKNTSTTLVLLASTTAIVATPTPAPAPTPTFDAASAASVASRNAQAAAESHAAVQSAQAAQASAAAAAKASADAAAQAAKASADAAAQAAAQAAKNTPTPPPYVAPTPAPVAPASSGSFTGGWGTYYFQNGIAGNCGTVAQDTDLVIAIDTAKYAGGANCNRKIAITRNSNGVTAVGTVRDSCPTCVNDNSLDMSKSLFEKLGTDDEGTFEITWKFI